MPLPLSCARRITRGAAAGAFLLVTAPAATDGASAQGRRAASVAPAVPAGVSAPVRDLRHEVTFDEDAARRGRLVVVTRFTAAGRDPVLLSLPAWTPGAYEVSDFARHVRDFGATAGGRALDWDKVDYDTWRVVPAGAGEVEVRFHFTGSTLDNAMTWLQRDFAFFNGTNVFLYAEGRSLDVPATVTIRTAPAWQVATSLPKAADGRTYVATSYHDLVDHPVFVGRLDIDSIRVNDGWSRIASYPAGALAGSARAELHAQVGRMIGVQAAVFGEVPWKDYTTLLVFDEGFGAYSALEHASSHLGIYDPTIIGNPILPSITAHEIFHAWNVKRLRPAAMLPYRYDVPQVTELLWVSEGITDYYADLTLVRAGIVPEAMFSSLTGAKIAEVADAVPVALEDASVSAWIQPTDGTASLYYPKGSLAGFLVDVMIRDASDNRRALDDVLRELYATTHRRGQGFTTAQFWAAASRAAGGRSFADFHERHVDGREPFPYATLLPLGGFRLVADTVRAPLLGISTGEDSTGVFVTAVDPDGVAAAAGVEPGDQLVSLGDITITDAAFGPRFRERYASRAGQPLPIVVRREGKPRTLQATVRMVDRITRTMQPDPNATPKARRIRDGILKGRVGT